MRLTTLKLPVAAVFLTLFLTATTNADPLFFSNTTALQNNGATRVNLFSNSGTLLVGPQLGFLVDITGMLAPSGPDTLRITYIEEGQAPRIFEYRVPLFDSVPPPYTHFFNFNIQNLSSLPRNATLTLDIIGSSPDFVIPSGPGAGSLLNSYTYSFRVAQPVPEPATLVFAGLGLVGVVARAQRRRPRER